MKRSLIICFAYFGVCFAQLSHSFINEEKCNKLGGPGTYEKLKIAVEESRTCVLRLFDYAGFLKEFNEAEEQEERHKVFIKYGNKMKNMNECMKNKVEIVKLCLTKEEKKGFQTVIEMLRKVGDYVYENDSERLIAFIENGGIECSKYGIRGLSKCFSENAIPHSLTSEGLVSISNDESCKNYEKLQNCFVNEMKDNCSSKVPANITEELFKYAISSICTNNTITRSRRSLRRLVRDVSGLSNRLPHIEAAVKRGCAKNGATMDTLEEHVEKMKTCFKEKPIFLTPKDEYISHIDKCTKDTIKIFEKCLPDKLKYFPKFMFDLVDSLVRLLYDDTREIGLGLGPCVPKLKSEESESKYHKCIEKVEENIAEDEIPTSKAKFCETFIPVSKCFTTQIKDTCEDSPDLEKFRKDYIKAMEEPCK